jgi:hypothetical protein
MRKNAATPCRLFFCFVLLRILPFGARSSSADTQFLTLLLYSTSAIPAIGSKFDIVIWKQSAEVTGRKIFS